ncbi:tRNA lysidine(34) synthetase TilS [Brevundimonas sp.]|uniref:tRNA lysidine(34) synthetase TilS n=1 Tax=Brevundimonas sp. TaxID=1871086 RepID=UPI0039195092
MDHPVALALSGGGDSMALLYLAADWCAGRGRRLLVLTVDHRLNPDSAAWTAFAGEAARSVGADWRGLCWDDPKPPTGLPAAAREARHALLAEAARAGGAHVILMAHTADDIAESDWMREQGATLGALRDWSPSPVWPQGRGVMLLRPLLHTSRAELRAVLTARKAPWLEDPGNADLRFLRTRARRALNPSPDGRRGPRAPERDSDPVLSAGDEGSLPQQETPNPHPAREEASCFASRCAQPSPGGRGNSWSGVLVLPRAVPARILAAALLSVSGQSTPPRGARLAALHARLAADADVTATLSGARLQTSGDTLLITREPGRGGLHEDLLPPNEPMVWDGRFEITAREAGWRAGALKGRMASLVPADQAIVKRLPASARPALPVLFRDDDPHPVLAWRAAGTRCLVAGRLIAAVGGIGHEDQLTHSSGETPPADLFLNRSGG